MASTIKLKNGSGAPTTGDLVQGEPALDLTNKRLYTENASGVVIEVGTNPSTIDINAGTIDGTVIGGSTAAAGTFTTGQFNTSLNVDGTVTADGLTSSGIIEASDGTNGEMQFGLGTALTTGAGTYDSSVRWNGSSGNLLFSQGAVEKMRITSTGIDVTGTVTADGLTVDGNAVIDGGATDNTVLTLDSGTANTYLKMTDSNSTSGVFIGATTNDLNFYPNNTLSAKFASGGDISFYEDTGTTAKFFWDASAESLGIGTSSPVGRLHSLATTAGDASLSLQLSGSSRFEFQQGIVGVTGDALRIIDTTLSRDYLMLRDGNVGIGTSSPGTTLDVIGPLRSNVSGGTPIVYLNNGTTQHSIQNTSGALTFFNDGTERVRIDSSGNVGIGTSSPNAVADLHVADTSDARIWLDATSADTMELYSGTGVGMFNRSNSYLMLGTNNTERMRIDSSGNVQQATSVNGDLYHHIYNANTGTSAEATLYVSNGSVVSGLFAGATGTNFTTTGGFVQDGAHIGSGSASAGGLSIITRASAPIRFYTNGHTNERMRIDASGNVGIGTSSPTGAKLQVVAESGSNVLGVGTTTQGLFIKTTGTTVDYNSSGNSAGEHTFSTGNTERMRLNTSGNLLVGTTDSIIWNDTSGEGVVIGPNAIQVARASDVCLLLNRQSTDGVVQLFASRGVQVGDITVGVSSTAYNTSSDQRLKENITDANDAGDKIDAIKVRQYDWKADGSHQDYGMVAQELMTVAPEAVSVPEDPEKMMGVDYSKLVPMMLKEIQSLRARVAQLEGAN